MGKQFNIVLKEVKKIMNTAKDGNMKVRGYISTIANCPYEGDIEPEKVSKLIKLLLDLGCYEISLGDTTGKATQKIWKI